MLKFRKHIAAKFLAFLTGIIFLNMSFFLTEIRLLGMHISHAKMIENVVKALAGVGFEEEKDSLGESAEGEEGHVVDLHILVHPLSASDCFSAFTTLHNSIEKGEVSASNAEIIIPPPKIS